MKLSNMTKQLSKKTISSILLVMLLLTACMNNAENSSISEEYEPSICLISEYESPGFNDDYDIQVEDYDPNTNTSNYYSFYSFLIDPNTNIKYMDAKTFMDINRANEDYSEFFFLIGSMYDIKTYHVMEQIQEKTKDSNLQTYFVSTEDIRNNEEVYSWYKDRFIYDENDLKKWGYVEGTNYVEGETIPSPKIIRWWNQVTFDVATLGPNVWNTKPEIEQFFKPLSEEVKEQYSLGNCKKDIWFLRNRDIIHSNY